MSATVGGRQSGGQHVAVVDRLASVVKYCAHVRGRRHTSTSTVDSLHNARHADNNAAASGDIQAAQ